MRYLNRIFLINSAQIKYAEITLDGNVHFIGTQGVGKSTLLRAILFFYNADSLKLGIPKEKKAFSEHYFPYSNSYIIYEVVRPDGIYCILAYKSRNKVCFRFINTSYNRNYFISPQQKARENWEGISRELDASRVFYTKRKIDSYSEYKDILYGNTKGRTGDLRRYALIESKDYQNIPRTIQNVFLNSELKAQFIKKTIIMSLGDDTKISLSNYTHHLKEFETQLSDIRKFQDEKTKHQANTISKLYNTIKYLRAERNQYAKELAFAVERNNEQEPRLKKELLIERKKESELKHKLNRASEIFRGKEKEISGQIRILLDKLKTTRERQEEYERKNIQQLLKLELQKPNLEKERTNLSNEKSLLTTQFQSLTQKYEALFKALQNELDDFINDKTHQKLGFKQHFQDFKSTLSIEYEKSIAQIRSDHKKEIDAARERLDEEKQIITNHKIEKERVKQKRFNENEIESEEQEKRLLEKRIEESTLGNEKWKDQIETLKKQWELEKKDLEKTFERDLEKTNDRLKTEETSIVELDQYLASSKSSLYGWLTREYPGWERTIGKVIDEKNVLFNDQLSPELTNAANNTFFGIELDLDQLNKTVKTVADYQAEKEVLIKKTDTLRTEIAQLAEQSLASEEKLRKKYRPQIKERKDGIAQNDYAILQQTAKLKEAILRINDLQTDAKTKKQNALDSIEIRISNTIESEKVAKNRVTRLEGELEKLINSKLKERDKKASEQQTELVQQLSTIDKEIIFYRNANQERKEQIQTEQQKELSEKGADTKRLTIIDNRLKDLNEELDLIEKNRNTVSDFLKDKRELFDKASDFKAAKKEFERKLTEETSKYDKQKENIKNKFESVQDVIQNLVDEITQIENDHEDFETFKTSECYTTIQRHFEEQERGIKTHKKVNELIEAIKLIHYEKLRKKTDDLRIDVNSFLGKFSDDNLFKFKKEGDDTSAFLQFAEDLSDFIVNDKITTLEKEVNARFSLIIQTIGQETTDLVSKEGEIQSVVTKINSDFVKRNFAGVIKKIELKLDESSNEVVQLLKLIKGFNDENIYELGDTDLFSSQHSDLKNRKAIDLLKQFIKKIGESKRDFISLSDSFELKFRIEENNNDTGWVEKLSNVGSEGTDVLVKAMINIMLLNVFKESASRKFKDFQLHCMMDEIGKLHPNNVRGILKFANDRNILLINSSPTENDALAFKHIYKLTKDSKSITKVKRIITQHSSV